MKKILLVEDDKFLSNILKLKLEKSGFEVADAFDGDEALKKLTAFNPDLMLLDIILPKKGGFELLAEMKEDGNLSKVPVIIISNLGQEEDIAKGKSLGAIDYFVKSRSSIDELVEKIKEIYQKGPAPQNL